MVKILQHISFLFENIGRFDSDQGETKSSWKAHLRSYSFPSRLINYDGHHPLFLRIIYRVTLQ